VLTAAMDGLGALDPQTYLLRPQVLLCSQCLKRFLGLKSKAEERTRLKIKYSAFILYTYK